MRGPRDVRHRQTNRGLLALVRRSPPRVPATPPARFIDQGARRPVGALGLGVLLEEALARALRAGPAATTAHLIGELVKQPPADPARPGGVAHRGEAGDAQRVEDAASPRHLGAGHMCVALRHDDVVDAVVDAAGPAQPHDVPVVDEHRLFHRRHEDACLAGPVDDSEWWMCVPCLMPDAKLHAPLSRKPSGHGTARPGLVPCPAMTGSRDPPNSTVTASSPR